MFLNRIRSITWTGLYSTIRHSTAGPIGMAAKKKKLGGKVGPIVEKKVMPVETDPQRLVNYVCGSNIMKTGEDIKIKPDSEYPDWLWTLPIGKPKTLDELDPDTKEYWRKLRKAALRRNNQLSKLKRF